MEVTVMIGPPPACAIATFRDALGLSFELSYHYPEGHVAVVISPTNRVVQFTARMLDPVGHDLVVDVAGPDSQHLLAAVGRRGGGLLMVSLQPRLRRFSPGERATYLQTRACLASRHIVLRDWIRTDGDLYQSAAFTAHPRSAWPDDPPAERRAELVWATELISDPPANPWRCPSEPERPG
jgi:hypothetical protein